MESREIKQKDSIGRWIWAIHRFASIYLDSKLQEYNFGSGQFIFLTRLFHGDGISQERLTELLNVNKATTARAISKLVKGGYVERKKDPTDKRAYRIYVTEKGKLLEPVMKKVAAQLTATLSLGFTEEEKKIVLNLLKRMFKNIVVVDGNGKISNE